MIKTQVISLVLLFQTQVFHLRFLEYAKLDDETSHSFLYSFSYGNSNWPLTGSDIPNLLPAFILSSSSQLLLQTQYHQDG